VVELQPNRQDDTLSGGLALLASVEQDTPSSLSNAGAIVTAITSEQHLVALACALGAGQFGGQLSRQERALCASASRLEIPNAVIDGAMRLIRAGGDPLGEVLYALRSGEERRGVGAYYTPATLVESMNEWLLAHPIDRVVDPGCGSGRFAAYIARRHPGLPITAIDADPIATLMTRAALAVLNTEAKVSHHNYLTFKLPRISGMTGFVGNPPYVRHHDLDAKAKVWAAKTARRLGIPNSGLAGLHVLFYMATAILMRDGDVGCFVTSAEWLDVGYGAMLRRLLTGRLYLESLALVAPDADQVFDDALATALVATFRAGGTRGIAAAQIARTPSAIDLTDRSMGLAHDTLAAATRWGPLLRGEMAAMPSHLVPLSTLARVHRGIATGANDFFVLTRERATELGVLPWCRPAITRAEEILTSNGVIRDGRERRLILLVPANIDRACHPQLDSYLKQGEEELRGKDGDRLPVAHTYLASHRKPWWYLGPVKTPAIVASYMARQAPAFAHNPDGLLPLNVAHGIYPNAPLTDSQALALVRQLNEARGSFRGRGRTYHGGLEKFEPREMESLLVRLDGADGST
jgi:adenine-specific DNA-methyltransferase